MVINIPNEMAYVGAVSCTRLVHFVAPLLKSAPVRTIRQIFQRNSRLDDKIHERPFVVRHAVAKAPSETTQFIRARIAGLKWPLSVDTECKSPSPPELVPRCSRLLA